METKLVKNNRLAIIPAGIIEGIEAFYDEKSKQNWVVIDGSSMPFDKASGNVQRLFAEAFLNDNRSRNYLEKKMGITSFREGLEVWLKCVAGGLDHVPDIANGVFQADNYNNTCTETECPHRGKFCGITTGLKDYEVESIKALKRGLSLEAAAGELCVSAAGMKSRVEVIKLKLGAKNMASMIGKAAEMGI